MPIPEVDPAKEEEYRKRCSVMEDANGPFGACAGVVDVEVSWVTSPSSGFLLIPNFPLCQEAEQNIPEEIAARCLSPFSGRH